jgi:hypothetical protein
MVTTHKKGTERVDFNQKREKKGSFAGKIITREGESLVG